MNWALILILAVLVADDVLGIVVERLNLRNLKAVLPGEFQGWYDARRYRESQLYLRDNTRLGIVRASVITPLTIAFLLLGGFNVVDRFARGFDLGMTGTGLVFIFVLGFASQLLSLPFSIYDTFVIEEKYGFNRTTPGTFAADRLKGWLLALAIGGPVLALILWIFQQAGPAAWAICWGSLILIQTVLMFVAPVVIMPLFNKFDPLPESELKREIEAYARALGFKLKGVFTMDGSKRSTKANAFFTGFGRFRRIVLYDTLLQHHSVDEVVSILAHEMGHFKKRHIFKTMALAFGTTGLMLFVLSFFINNTVLFEAFRMDRTSIYASLVFFGFLYAPMEMLLSVFANTLSRRYEYQADAFAVRTYGKPESLISALKKLSVENLSNLTPHPLKVWLHYGHPPILDRIRVIREMKRGPSSKNLLDHFS